LAGHYLASRTFAAATGPRRIPSHDCLHATRTLQTGGAKPHARNDQSRRWLPPVGRCRFSLAATVIRTGIQFPLITRFPPKPPTMRCSAATRALHIDDWWNNSATCCAPPVPLPEGDAAGFRGGRGLEIQTSRQDYSAVGIQALPEGEPEGGIAIALPCMRGISQPHRAVALAGLCKELGLTSMGRRD